MGATNELVEPADLGVRIGTKKEVFFEKVRKALDEELEACELTAELNREFLVIIERKITEEKKNI
jgi:hypothetical protein